MSDARAAPRGGWTVATGCGSGTRTGCGVLVALLAVATAGMPPAGPPGPAAGTKQEPAKDGKTGSEPPPGRFTEALEVVATPIEDETVVPLLANQVSVVTREQIDALEAHDLPSALRRVPGVVVSRYDPVGSYGGAGGGAIYIRGQGSGRPGAEISVMLDGIPRAAGVWSHPLMDMVGVEAAGRIEVYKSPQPVLFGNAAFGAANVVPMRIEAPGTFTRAAGSVGSFGTRAARVVHGVRTGAADVLVAASAARSSGHREDADGSVGDLYGRFGVRLDGGWEVALQVDATDGWAHDPRVEGESRPPAPERFSSRSLFTLATVSHRGPRSSRSIKIYRDHVSMDWRQRDASPRELFRTLTGSTNRGVRLLEHVTLAQGTELVLGFDHDESSGWTTERRTAGDLPFGPLTLRNDAPYVVVSRSSGDATRTTVSAGVRYNRSSVFGGDWGLQAGLAVASGPLELHVNAARAFNLPGAYVAVMDARWSGGRRWRDLGSETLDHAEVGVERRFGSAAVTVTAFADRVSGALRFVPPPPPPPAFANLGGYTVRGLEVTAAVTPLPAVSGFLGATVTRADPDTVPNAPRWTAVAGVAFVPSGRWRCNLDAEWMAATYVLNPRYPGPASRVDGHLLVNGKISRRLTPPGPGARLDLFAAVENLADTAYEVRPGYPMPGLSLSVGIEAAL